MKAIQINGIIVHEDVITTKFACDYQVCHGGCCSVENDKGIVYEGCEITEDEERLILSSTTTLGRLLEKGGRRLPKRCTYKKNGQRYVTCNAKGRCCLQLSQGCALRVAQREGTLLYGPPSACQLYPIILTGRKRVHLHVGHYYDKFHLCDGAFLKGKSENIYLVDFVKNAIVARFGKDFFLKLHKRVHEHTHKNMCQ